MNSGVGTDEKEVNFQMNGNFEYPLKNTTKWLCVITRNLSLLECNLNDDMVNHNPFYTENSEKRKYGHKAFWS